jgi:hypothetical protein
LVGKKLYREQGIYSILCYSRICTDDSTSNLDMDVRLVK